MDFSQLLCNVYSKAPLFQNTEKEGKIIDHLYSTYRAFNCRINLINKRYKADAKTLTTSHLKSTPPALAPAFLIETPFQKGSIPPPPKLYKISQGHSPGSHYPDAEQITSKII